MLFVWGFNFKAPIDSSTGKPSHVDINNYSEVRQHYFPPPPPSLLTHLQGIASAPLPFECSVEPRSQHHAMVIQREFHALRPVFERYEHELSEEDKEVVRLQALGKA